jgi:hypothetical protein
MRILAFDIGIKNLAFCVLEQGAPHQVIELHNVNLLAPPPVTRCTACTAKASFEVLGAPYCRRHAPKTHPIRAGLTVTASHEALKAALQALGVTPPRTKAACWTALAQHAAIPIAQPKGENASKVSLDVVHDALRTLVRDKWPVWEGCDQVLLENQPAFKNPHMKSVQILVYATLREAFLSRGLSPTFQFVHAKKKVQAAKGDAGYAERKSKSEDRCAELFESGEVQGPEAYVAWRAATKKSDMADALCMTVDACSSL